jgi:hypothetical protein
MSSLNESDNGKRSTGPPLASRKSLVPPRPSLTTQPWRRILRPSPRQASQGGFRSRTGPTGKDPDLPRFCSEDNHSPRPTYYRRRSSPSSLLPTCIRKIRLALPSFLVLEKEVVRQFRPLPAHLHRPSTRIPISERPRWKWKSSPIRLSTKHSHPTFTLPMPLQLREG